MKKEEVFKKTFEEVVEFTPEMAEKITPKEVLPREENISGTQKECDAKLRELKEKYEVATIGVSASNNFVSYVLWLSKK